MDLSFTVFALGTIPYFTSRMCGSLFWIAVLARMQHHGYLEFIQQIGFVRIDLSLFFPEWFIHPTALMILGVLALVELVAEKNPDIAQLYRSIDGPVKGIGHFLLTKVVVVRVSVAVTAALSYQAGWGASFLGSLVAGVLVWLLAGVRGRLLESLTEMDDGDDLGIRKWLSWFEDAWVGLGMAFLVILPAVALVISGITVLLVVVFQRVLKAREAKHKQACPECGAATHLSAFKCPSCGRLREKVSRISFLGAPRPGFIDDPEEHRLYLLFRKRCTVCATRLPKRALVQDCVSCGSRVFSSPESVDAYLSHLQGKLPKILAISFGLSLIPLIGLIPGIIYYKLGLISGMRAYLPVASGCLTRWITRVFVLILLGFQWIPVIGGLSLPLMCLIHYAVYRQAMLREKKLRF